MRASAARSAPLVDAVDADASSEVAERGPDRAPAAVPNGAPVWVLAQYVEHNGEVGRVIAPGVPARPYPSTGQRSMSLGLFEKGDLLEITGRKDGWLEVRVIGRTPR